jgi:nucleotide-binding universal stress UspA family protein
MSGPVVIGFDGSDSGEDALALGGRLARATGERAIVVAVYPEEAPIGPGRVDAEWVAHMRGHAQEAIAHARRLAGEEGADYRVVGSGSAAHGLDDVAEAERASVIVVGSTQRGTLRRILPGSTGQRLLHGASCAVAIAPRGLRDREDGAFSAIGCAFLDTADGREALRFAADLAQRVGSRLRVYTVIAPRAEVFSPVIGRDAEEAFISNLRQAYRAALDRALAGLPSELEADGELLVGDVVDALSALDERDVDLLVLGSRGYGPLQRVLLGGVSSRVIRHAASPVVVVPRSDEDGR